MKNIAKLLFLAFFIIISISNPYTITRDATETYGTIISSEHSARYMVLVSDTNSVPTYVRTYSFTHPSDTDPGFSSKQYTVGADYSIKSYSANLDCALLYCSTAGSEKLSIVDFTQTTPFQIVDLIGKFSIVTNEILNMNFQLADGCSAFEFGGKTYKKDDNAADKYVADTTVPTTWGSPVFTSDFSWALGDDGIYFHGTNGFELATGGSLTGIGPNRKIFASDSNSRIMIYHGTDDANTNTQSFTIKFYSQSSNTLTQVPMSPITGTSFKVSDTRAPEIKFSPNLDVIFVSGQTAASTRFLNTKKIDWTVDPKTAADFVFPTGLTAIQNVYSVSSRFVYGRTATDHVVYSISGTSLFLYFSKSLATEEITDWKRSIFISNSNGDPLTNYLFRESHPTATDLISLTIQYPLVGPADANSRIQSSNNMGSFVTFSPPNKKYFVSYVLDKSSLSLKSSYAETASSYVLVDTSGNQQCALIYDGTALKMLNFNDKTSGLAASVTVTGITYNAATMPDTNIDISDDCSKIRINEAVYNLDSNGLAAANTLPNGFSMGLLPGFTPKLQFIVNQAGIYKHDGSSEYTEISPETFSGDKKIWYSADKLLVSFASQSAGTWSLSLEWYNAAVTPATLIGQEVTYQSLTSKPEVLVSPQLTKVIIHNSNPTAQQYTHAKTIDFTTSTIKDITLNNKITGFKNKFFLTDQILYVRNIGPETKHSGYHFISNSVVQYFQENLPAELTTDYQTSVVELVNNIFTIYTQTRTSTDFVQIIKTEKTTPTVIGNILGCTTQCQYCEDNLCSCSSDMTVCDTVKYNGYFKSGTTPTRCDDSCVTCTGTANNTCQSCKPGFYLSPPVTGTCIPCLEGCAACTDESTCTKCKLGYVQAGTSCVKCFTGCTNCDPTNVNVCSSCAGGFSAVTVGSITTCRKKIPNCQTQSNVGCSICDTGYTPDANQVCIQDCEAPCSTCSATNPLKCLSCVGDGEYTLTEGFCKASTPPACNSGDTCTSCDQGFTVQAGRCLQCDAASNCKTCLINDFEHCKDCRKGFYLTKDYKCQACTEPCFECVTNQLCTKCKPGYVLSGGQGSKSTCKPCGQRCETCKEFADVCETCKSGYVLEGWNCINSTKISVEITMPASTTSISVAKNQQMITKLATIFSVEKSNIFFKQYSSITKILSVFIESTDSNDPSGFPKGFPVYTPDLSVFVNNEVIYKLDEQTTSSYTGIFTGSFAGEKKIWTFGDKLLVSVASQTSSNPGVWKLSLNWYDLTTGFEKVIAQDTSLKTLTSKPEVLVSPQLTKVIIRNSNPSAVSYTYAKTIDFTTSTTKNITLNYKITGLENEFFLTDQILYVRNIGSPNTHSGYYFINDAIFEYFYEDIPTNLATDYQTSRVEFVGNKFTIYTKTSATNEIKTQIAMPLSISQMLTYCFDNLCECPSGQNACDTLKYYGYFKSGTIPTRCHDSCVTCSGTANNTCQSCKAGFYLSSATIGSCSACLQGCANCDSLFTCSSCKLGYVKVGIYCIKCFTGCTNCDATNINACSSCADGFQTVTVNSITTCRKKILNCQTQLNGRCSICDTGYTENNGVCPLNCESPCSTCSTTNPLKCLSCVGDGEYTLTEGFCKASTPPACNSGDTCTSCPQGFTLYKGECLQCNAASNCKTCLINDLEHCKDCRKGFYLTADYKCQACTEPCFECVTNQLCTKCKPGYVLSGGQGTQSTCKPCAQRCETCKGFADVCETCATGYSLQGWNCIKNTKISVDIIMPAQITQISFRLYDAINAKLTALFEVGLKKMFFKQYSSTTTLLSVYLEPDNTTHETYILKTLSQNLSPFTIRADNTDYSLQFNSYDLQIKLNQKGTITSIKHSSPEIAYFSEQATATGKAFLSFSWDWTTKFQKANVIEFTTAHLLKAVSHNKKCAILWASTDSKLKMYNFATAVPSSVQITVNSGVTDWTTAQLSVDDTCSHFRINNKVYHNLVAAGTASLDSFPTGTTLTNPVFTNDFSVIVTDDKIFKYAPGASGAPGSYSVDRSGLTLNKGKQVLRDGNNILIFSKKLKTGTQWSFTLEFAKLIDGSPSKSIGSFTGSTTDEPKIVYGPKLTKAVVYGKLSTDATKPFYLAKTIDYAGETVKDITLPDVLKLSFNDVSMTDEILYIRNTNAQPTNKHNAFLMMGQELIQGFTGDVSALVQGSVYVRSVLRKSSTGQFEIFCIMQKNNYWIVIKSPLVLNADIQEIVSPAEPELGEMSFTFKPFQQYNSSVFGKWLKLSDSVSDGIGNFNTDINYIEYKPSNSNKKIETTLNVVSSSTDVRILGPSSTMDCFMVSIQGRSLEIYQINAATSAITLIGDLYAILSDDFRDNQISQAIYNRKIQTGPACWAFSFRNYVYKKQGASYVITAATSAFGWPTNVTFDPTLKYILAGGVLYKYGTTDYASTSLTVTGLKSSKQVFVNDAGTKMIVFSYQPDTTDIDPSYSGNIKVYHFAANAWTKISKEINIVTSSGKPNLVFSADLGVIGVYYNSKIDSVAQQTAEFYKVDVTSTPADLKAFQNPSTFTSSTQDQIRLNIAGNYLSVLNPDLMKEFVYKIDASNLQFIQFSTRAIDQNDFLNTKRVNFEESPNSEVNQLYEYVANNKLSLIKRPLGSAAITNVINALPSNEIGYFLQGTSLVPCPSGCSSCLSLSVCTACLTGFALNDKSVCIRCNPLCQKCSIDGASCTNPVDGYFLNAPNSNLPARCDSTCITCSGTGNNKCTSCKVGSFLETLPQGQCKPCIVGCDYCLDDSSCQKCKLGYVFHPTLSKCIKCLSGCTSCNYDKVYECIECEAGFQPTITGNAITKCSRCPSKCSTCSAGVCSQCENGFRLLSNQCVAQCEIPCKQCGADPKSCTSCIAGYSFAGGVCSPSLSCNTDASCTVCPLGYNLVTGKCLACDAGADCRSCSKTNPSSCVICKKGTFLNSDSKCQSCDATGCSACISNSVCSQCSAGFVLESGNDKLSRCLPCDPVCATCKGSPENCETCANGYTLRGWRCVSNFNVKFQIKLDGNFLEMTTTDYLSIADSLSTLLKVPKDKIVIDSLVPGSIVMGGSVESSSASNQDALFKDASVQLVSGTNVGGFPIISSSLTSATTNEVKNNGDSGSKTQTVTVTETVQIYVNDDSQTKKYRDIAIIVGILIPVGLILIFIILLLLYKKGIICSEGIKVNPTSEKTFVKVIDLSKQKIDNPSNQKFGRHEETVSTIIHK